MLAKEAIYRTRNSIYTVHYPVKMELAFLLLPFEWNVPLSLSAHRLT